MKFLYLICTGLLYSSFYFWSNARDKRLKICNFIHFAESFRPFLYLSFHKAKIFIKRKDASTCMKLWYSFILSQRPRKIGYFWLSESFLELSNLLKGMFLKPLKVIYPSLKVWNKFYKGFPVFNIVLKHFLVLVCLWRNSKQVSFMLLFIFFISYFLKIHINKTGSH